jgi:hypothetical protein
VTRVEHVAWAKARALEYVDRDELANAVSSMISDMGKHPEINMNGVLVAAMAVMTGHELRAAEVRHWIEGFN